MTDKEARANGFPHRVKVRTNAGAERVIHCRTQENAMLQINAMTARPAYRKRITKLTYKELT